jgi:hypothetical protein
MAALRAGEIPGLTQIAKQQKAKTEKRREDSRGVFSYASRKTEMARARARVIAA